KTKDPSLLGAAAPDPHTLAVSFDRPYAFFLSMAATRTLYPVPEHVLKNYKDQSWTRAGKLDSTVPVRLGDSNLERGIKLVPHEHYFDRNNVMLVALDFVSLEYSPM